MENLPRTMEDNLAPDHQSATNTNFLEERTQITEQAKHDVSMKLPQSVEVSMPEDHWMARQQLMKPVLVSQVDWTMSQARNTQILAFNFPGILAGIESVVNRTLAMYAFYKLTPVIRLQVNATQFHQGQLILSFDPFGQAVDTGTPDDEANLLPMADIYYSTGLPNVKVMASEVDPIELMIPFVHPRSFLTSNTPDGFDNMGRVRLQVLNPLVAAEGASSSLAVTIWVYAKDASVHVPMNYHVPQLPTFEPAIPTGGFEHIMENIGGGFVNAGRMAGNFFTGNFGKFLRNGQGLIDNLGEIFGFDYPTRPLAAEKTITPVENMAISVGASRSQRMCLDPVSGYIPDPQVFGTTSDDLDLMRIAKTPMLVAQFSWSSTQAVATKLFDVPVTPMLVPSNLPRASNISYLAYVSSLFNYWRGGIVFDVEFVATHFHSGRIVAAFVPNLDPTSLTYANATSSLPNLVLDLQQTSKISFTVPFVSATPLKYVFLTQELADESIIGNLGFFVMNKLAAAANVSPSVEVNVYIRAADDFQLFVPANPGISYRRLPPTESATPTISGIEIQSNRTKDTETTPVASLTLGSGHAPKELRFGEMYSLVDLIRRFNFLERLTLTAISTQNFSDTTPSDIGTDRIRIVSPTLELSNPTTNNNPQYRTMLGNFSRIFSVWSGSIRYKDVTDASRTSNLLYGITHLPSYYPYDASSDVIHSQGYAFITTNLSQDNAVEFEVPYYSPYQCLLTKYPRQGIDSPLRICVNGTILSTAYSGTTQDPPVTVNVYRYHAGGDDFKFAYLRPPGAEYLGDDSSNRTINHNYVL